MSEAKKTRISLPAKPKTDEAGGERRRAPIRSTSSATPRIRPDAARRAKDESQDKPVRARPSRTDSARTDETRDDKRRFEKRSDAPRKPAPDGDRPARARKETGDAPARAPRRTTATETTNDATSRTSAPRAQFERRTRGADGVHQTNTAPRTTPRAAPASRDPDGALRLSKRMTELGLCSRREADEYIERGWVLVDGKVVDTLGAKVLPHQQIELKRGAASAQLERVTILLHKPVGYVSGQAEDGYEPASVLITPDNQWSLDPSQRQFETRHMKKLAPAGRLDIDSTGLLVLTQDGRIAKQLIGEDSEIEKEYLVRVEGPLSYDDLDLLNHGLMLDGVPLRPAKVSWQNEHQLRFVLREGRKRQIRRMCELVGLRVTALKRIRIGQVKLAKLPPGQWRYLGEHEKF